MPIEIVCAGCGQTLRVADEHAGKMARCPQCGTVAPVPAPVPPLAPPIQLQPASAGANPFAAPPASPLPSPFAQPGPSQPLNGTASPFEPSAVPLNPYAAPTTLYPSAATNGRVHRGGAVLTFGILGLVMLPFGLMCCLPLGVLPLGFGITAWVMGGSDLRAMRDGQMDPSGRSLTLTGMILGIVATSLFALVVILFVVLMVASNARQF